MSFCDLHMNLQRCSTCQNLHRIKAKVINFDQFSMHREKEATQSENARTSEWYMADVLLPIFLPFEYLTYNNPPLLVCVFRLGFHADSVDCIFIPTWWCEGRGFDPQWRQAFLCLCGFIWVLHAEDVTHWSCTNPPSGLHIWYNPCTIIHVVILVRGLNVHIYWT